MRADSSDAALTAPYGWESSFPGFREASPRVIRGRLQEVLREVSPQQIGALDASIPLLQREVGEVLDRDLKASEWTAILVSWLPMESRRTDVIVLLRPNVMVLELKGKIDHKVTVLDQAAVYAGCLE